MDSGSRATEYHTFGYVENFQISNKVELETAPFSDICFNKAFRSKAETRLKETKTWRNSFRYSSLTWAIKLYVGSYTIGSGSRAIKVILSGSSQELHGALLDIMLCSAIQPDVQNFAKSTSVIPLILPRIKTE